MSLLADDDDDALTGSPGIGRLVNSEFWFIKRFAGEDAIRSSVRFEPLNDAHLFLLFEIDRLSFSSCENRFYLEKVEIILR